MQPMCQVQGARPANTFGAQHAEFSHAFEGFAAAPAATSAHRHNG